MKAWLVLAAATLVAALVFPPAAWVLGFFLLMKPLVWALERTLGVVFRGEMPKG